MCLGPNLKYSSCIYDQPGMTLEEAEVAMLGEAQCWNGDDRRYVIDWC
jgi:hypothetical protein